MGVEHATPGAVGFLLVVFCILMYAIRRVAGGRIYFIRRIPGIDAINKAIGRATENGRPVVFSNGLTTMGPVAYACLGIFSHVVRRVVRLRNRFFAPQYQPDVMALAESVAAEACLAEKRPDALEPGSIQYLSDEQFAYASGYLGLVHRERAGAAFLMGEFAAESLVLAEAGQRIGATQVAGTVSPEQVPFFVATCDYTLIGEELFAASAYLTNEPVQVASLRAQDVAKLVFLAIIVVGVLIATVNSVAGTDIPNVSSLFSWSPW
jgi:hypothetical protein